MESSPLCVPLADGSLVISQFDVLLCLYNGGDHSFIILFAWLLRPYSYLAILKYAHIRARNRPFSIISGFVHI